MIFLDHILSNINFVCNKKHGVCDRFWNLKHVTNSQFMAQFPDSGSGFLQIPTALKKHGRRFWHIPLFRKLKLCNNVAIKLRKGNFLWN